TQKTRSAPRQPHTACLRPYNVIGEARQAWLSCVCQSIFPLFASRAVKVPLSSPKKSSPPPVESTPEYVRAGPVCANSQAVLPVSRSSARIYFRLGSSRAGRNVPPIQPALPCCHGVLPPGIPCNSR